MVVVFEPAAIIMVVSAIITFTMATNSLES